LAREIYEAARGRNHKPLPSRPLRRMDRGRGGDCLPKHDHGGRPVAGIQRGADLVSYLGVLTLLVVAFLGYERYVRLQEQVTVLVRRLAILEAHKVPPAADPLNSPDDYKR